MRTRTERKPPKPHAPAPPQTTSEVRAYWRSLIVSTTCIHASLLEWLPQRETDLRKLPLQVFEPTRGKCAQLLDRCCQAEALGQGRRRIEQRMNAELWNFMKQLAPSRLFPAHAQPGVLRTADLFDSHDDTAWPEGPT